MVVTVIALADDQTARIIAAWPAAAGAVEPSITDRSGVRLAPADRHEQPRRGSSVRTPELSGSEEAKH
jgi:hypothetical protein